MKVKWIITLPIFLALFLLFSVDAVMISSTNYGMDLTTSSGGDNAESTNYETDFMTGEISGNITSESYNNYLGFFYSTNITKSYSISMSENLTAQIRWNITTLPFYNSSAGGNNGTGITSYWINVSARGTSVDVYVKASGDLETGDGDVLGLGNETFSFSTTDNLVPSSEKHTLTTDYTDNKIGDGLVNGSVIYLKFFLDAPSAQAAGFYNNSLLFKAVVNGESP